MPYRVYVPKTWDGKMSLPIILMLHGAGANEGTYLDQADGLLMKLAEQHDRIRRLPIFMTEGTRAKSRSSRPWATT
jgi:predicted peptidase